MSVSNTYLPRKDAELADWAEHFAAGITANKAAWSIPDDEAAALQEAADAFKDLHEQAVSPQKNQVITAQKNAAKDALIAAVRSMVNFRLQNPLISDADRVALGLHVRDHTPSPVPPPSTRPEAEPDSSMIRQITVHFRDAGSTSRAKPAGVHGAEIRWSLLDHAPATIEALVNSDFDTKSPYTFVFEEAQRGKMLYFCLRWENSKGEKGPWSEIYNAVIP